MVEKKIFTYLKLAFIFCTLITFGFLFSKKLDYKVSAQATSGDGDDWVSSCNLPTPTPIPYHIDGNLKVYEDYNPLADGMLNRLYSWDSCIPNGNYWRYYNRSYVRPSDNPIIDRFCGGRSLDIAIAMDTTTSLSSDEFQKEKETIKSFIRAFKGQGNVRISLTTFARGARKVFGLLEEKDWESMCNEIDNRHRYDYTYWDSGIEVATSTFDGNSKNRAKLIAFFTDGSPNPSGRFPLAKIKANAAKAQGIRILAILIGDNSDHASYPEDKIRQISGLRELMPISSGNYSERDVSYADFISTSFSSLQKTLKDFTNTACPIISPTPSPTPSPANEGWFKLKNTSFNNTDPEQRNNVIPQVVSEYDNIDDTSEKQLIVGEGGLVTTESSFSLSNTNIYSNNNWLSRGYKFKRFFSNTASYIGYIKQKSNEVVEIDSVVGIDEDPNKKIYFLKNKDLTINDVSKLDKKNLVIIVGGNNNDGSVDDGGVVDFNIGNGAAFNPTHSITIIAKEIKFYNKDTSTSLNTNWSGTLSSAKGIFIADTINVGNTIDTGIKIIGNLIALENPVINYRRQTDYTKPSIFVVFDPKIYLDMIPALGLKTFDYYE